MSILEQIVIPSNIVPFQSVKEQKQLILILTNADGHFPNGHQLVAPLQQLVHDCAVDYGEYVLAQEWHACQQSILELLEKN